MSRFVILVMAVFLFASSCVKKSEPVNCYSCVSNDSVVSNIPVYNNAHYKTIYGTKCEMTDGQINFYQKSNTKYDTLFYRNDSLIGEYWTMKCDID